MQVKTLKQYISIVTNLVARSDVAKNALRQLFGHAPRKQTIRWFSVLLVTAQHFTHFNGLLDTITSLKRRKVSKKNVAKLLPMVEYGQKRNELLAEMALVLDFDTTPFKTSMFLEGDGYIPHLVYPELMKLKDHLDNFHLPAKHPLLTRVMRKIVASRGFAVGSPDFNAEVERFRAANLRKVRHAIKYYNDKFFAPNATLRLQVRMFRALQLLNPTRIEALRHHVTASDGWLSEVPFVDARSQAQLFIELDHYRGYAGLLPPQSRVAPLAFFANPANVLPAWSNLARDAVHASPSSAGCERVFGLTANMFSELQHNQLNDAATAAVMLAHNSRQPQNKTKPNDELPTAGDDSKAANIYFPPWAGAVIGVAPLAAAPAALAGGALLSTDDDDSDFAPDDDEDGGGGGDDDDDDDGDDDNGGDDDDDDDDDDEDDVSADGDNDDADSVSAAGDDDDDDAGSVVDEGNDDDIDNGDDDVPDNAEEAFIQEAVALQGRGGRRARAHPGAYRSDNIRVTI